MPPEASQVPAVAAVLHCTSRCLAKVCSVCVCVCVCVLCTVPCVCAFGLLSCAHIASTCLHIACLIVSLLARDLPHPTTGY